MMMQYMREKDLDTLQYLTNVTANETSKPPTCSIELTFKENEYFTNEKLTLKVEFKDESRDEVVETIGTIVDWKDGKDITTKKIKKKQKNKKTGETRNIVKTVPAESFYNCFESRKAPEGGRDEAAEDEDEETEKLMDALDESMQIAMDFNDLYMWEALEYYLNFGQNPGDFMDMNGGPDGDDDDDDQEDEPKPKKQPKKKGGDAVPEGGEGEKQECKQ